MHICMLFGLPDSSSCVSNKLKSKPQDLICCVSHEIIVIVITIAGIFHHSVV
jgi:hypothetical protein